MRLMIQNFRRWFRELGRRPHVVMFFTTLFAGGLLAVMGSSCCPAPYHGRLRPLDTVVVRRADLRKKPITQEKEEEEEEDEEGDEDAEEEEGDE